MCYDLEVVLLIIDESIFLHLTELLREGSPVQVEIIRQLLSVEGNIENLGSGLAGFRGEIGEDLPSDGFRCGVEDTTR